MASAEGWSLDDVRAANKALERWQLVQKGHSIEEADALILEAEDKAKEVRFICSELPGNLAVLVHFLWFLGLRLGFRRAARTWRTA